MLQFAITMNKESFVPGESICLTVHAAKDSYVGLSAIDQSALLLGKTRHNFDRNDVLHELTEYGKTDNANSFDPIHVSCILYFYLLFTSCKLNVKLLNRVLDYSLDRRQIQMDVSNQY